MHLVEQKYAIASNTAEYMDAFIVLVNVILKMERSKKKNVATHVYTIIFNLKLILKIL